MAIKKTKLNTKHAKGKTAGGSKPVLDRIARIEGQLRGIRRMVEEKKECIDIITQISAIREATARLGIELLKDDFICKKMNVKMNEKYLKTLFKIN